LGLGKIDFFEKCDYGGVLFSSEGDLIDFIDIGEKFKESWFIFNNYTVT
jgi:hypothetical protein